MMQIYFIAVTGFHRYGMLTYFNSLVSLAPNRFSCISGYDALPLMYCPWEVCKNQNIHKEEKTNTHHKTKTSQHKTICYPPMHSQQASCIVQTQKE